MLEQELLTLGLSTKESQIYLAVLQLGYASVQDIADKTGINRTTIYSQVRNMISKGLVNTVVRAEKIFYVAERPEKLQFIYEEKEKELRRKRNLLDQILPQLESIYNLAKDKPTVKFYHFDKPSELLALREEIQLFRARELYNIFNFDLHGDLINKQHIGNLLLGADSFKVLYISKNKILDHRLHSFTETGKMFFKYLPVSKFNFVCEILVADDRVCIGTDKNSLIIQDRLFAQTVTLLFNALWGMAEPLP